MYKNHNRCMVKENNLISSMLIQAFIFLLYMICKNNVNKIFDYWCYRLHISVIHFKLICTFFGLSLSGMGLNFRHINKYTKKILKKL